MPNTVNTVRWSQIHPPALGAGHYEFATNKMIGIQFHVPAVASAPKGAYSFCVSQLTFIRN
jgi:hypothetical protein